MTMRLALICAATALASSTAFAQEQAASAVEKARVESCAAHKFETTVEVIADGKKRSSKVRLCGKQGQTDAAWAGTLKDAVEKLKVNTTMAPAARDQVVAALIAEIARIEAANAAASTPLAATASPLGSELPVAIVPPAARPPQYSTLPPLPTAPSVVTKSPLTRPAVPLRIPRLTIRCFTPGQPGGGPCVELERNTQLTIRADENLAGGTGLRFLRRGDFRGEVALAQMRKGQSLRSRLPPQLCSGVVRSDVEIQILARGATGANQVVDTLGPYQLRC